MKGQKGITLVALVITIIVMLILVGVSLSIVLNGGLIDKANETGENWKAAQEQDKQGGSYNVNGNILNGVGVIEHYTPQP